MGKNDTKLEQNSPQPQVFHTKNYKTKSLQINN